jgi:hypothetical protein
VTDESTLGGYIAVHTRPPAFTGVDGGAYTVDVAVDETGGYLLFLRWDGEPPTIKGHLESEYLVRGTDESMVRAALDRLPLLDVKTTLDALIRER